jgi:hypothetical protein
MPRPKTLDECRKELSDSIPRLKLKGSVNHLNFYAVASQVLLSRDDVDSGLAWLNTLMERKLEARVGASALGSKKTEFVEYYAGGRGTKVADFRKLLTETLTEFEARIGFVDKIPNLLRELAGPEFGSVLRAGAHWKDPGAGVQHGEFTHRIQWFLVVVSGKLDAPAAGPRVSAYRALTEITRFSTGLNPADRVRPELEYIPLWSVLFDRLTEFWEHEGSPNGLLKQACDMQDFRCPEFLHPHIIATDNRARWPLLGAFLHARTLKRETFLQPAVRLQYIVKKLHVPSDMAAGYAKELEQVYASNPNDAKLVSAFLKQVLDKHGTAKGYVAQ